MASTINIRNAFAAILLKQESTEGTLAAGMSGATDAIPVEQDSISLTTPYKLLDSNEATASLVDSAPVAIAQPCVLTFKSRVKGAGVGTVYTSTVRPPHHFALAACGKKPIFQAAITTALCSAGTIATATLGTGYSSVAQTYRGMPVVFSAGSNSGVAPMVADYSSTKVATFTDAYATAFDATSSCSIPANYTYAGTSPMTANRASDQPSCSIVFYKDGVSWTIVGARGTVDIEIGVNNVAYYNFTFTGVFVAFASADVPVITYASQSAPLFVQANSADLAFAANRKPLPVSKVSLKENAQIDSPEDPNSSLGFQASIIGQRSASLSIDPLLTLSTTRNTLNEIAANSVYSSVVRIGNVSGNRAAITMPNVQPVQSNLSSRGQLATEDWMAKILNAPTQDPNNRDGDWIIAYW